MPDPTDPGSIIPPSDSGSGGSGGSGGTSPADPNVRADVRKLLALYGINLNITPTMADLEEAAKKIVGLQTQIRNAQADMANTNSSLGWGTDPGDRAAIIARWNNLNTLSTQLADAAQQFQTSALGLAQAQNQKQADSPRDSGTYLPQLQSLFTDFQTLVRPAKPTVARLPTAQEYMSDFNDAYDTIFQEKDAAMESAGLSPEMRDWAKTEYKATKLQEYNSAMGAIAQSGQSPFYLSEVGFDQRYPGAAGDAQRAAAGAGPGATPQVVTGGETGIQTTTSQFVTNPGTPPAGAGVGAGTGARSPIPGINLGNLNSFVASWTTPSADDLNAREQQAIKVGDAQTAQKMQMLQAQLKQEQSIQSAQLQVDALGGGTPRDFIALPKIDPSQWLQQNLDPAMIKLEYEGSRTGAGRRYLMGGDVSPKQAGPTT